MTIYGVALLALCYLTGILLGEYLGWMLGINANVGGVGFAMMLLIMLQSWPVTKKWFVQDIPSGIGFWSKMYIPIIIAMSAIQNAHGAFSSGLIALLAGIIPTLICFAIIPILTKMTRKHASH